MHVFRFRFFNLPAEVSFEAQMPQFVSKMRPSKFDAVGVNVKVLIEAEDDWFDGVVEQYHPKKGYHIQLFDGQDLWLDALNENVQFEEEFETAEINIMGDDTLKSTTNFDVDELEIVEDNYRMGGTTTVGNKLVVPDYHSHQEYNQRSIRADLITLPARGVLLSGSVLGTAGLVMDEAMDGEVFFKVLFVEGGSKPAMFRCKTPIFTSEAVICSLSDPRWEAARFQFDMIMPEDALQDAKSPFGFKIQGEIIIAVYVSRSSGGSSLLGQASFQLKDAVETGTVEFFASGYEGRSITGAHTLLSRAGEVSGEVDVQLNIAWKSLHPPVTASIAQARLLGNTSSGVADGPSRPSSAVGPKPSAAVSSKGTLGASKTATGSNLPPRRPTSGTATRGATSAGAPRAIVSNLQRKQREDAVRIARENQKLQQTLLQHANRNSTGKTSSTTPATAGSAYGPQTAGSVAVAAASKTMGAGREASHIAEAKSSTRVRESGGAKTSAGASGAKSSDSQNIDTLLKLFNDLKRASALDEQENVRLKLKVGKLKVSVKQAEMSVDRIRGQPGSAGSVSKGGNSLRSSRDNQYTSDPKDAVLASTSRSPALQAKAMGGNNNTTTVNAGAHEYIPFFEPLSDAALKAQNITDGEYTSLAEEYNVLQSVRRGLLDRARTAQLACEASMEKQGTAEERMTMIRRRVGYYRDIAGKLAGGVNLALGGAEAVGGRSMGAKGNAPDPDLRDCDDFVLFDRLRDGKQEYAAENALYEAALPTAAQVSAMAELTAVRDFLADKCTTAEDRIRVLKEETEQLHVELRKALQKDKTAPSTQDLVKQARASGKNSLSREAEDRLQAAQAGINQVEQELKGILSRQQSRKTSFQDDFTLSPDGSDVE